MAHIPSAYCSHLKRIGIALMLSVLIAAVTRPVLAANWSLTTIHTFSDVHLPYSPHGELLLANDGNFYGSFNGAIWAMTPAGTLTVVHTLTASEGVPTTGLIQGADGNFYGTASYNGYSFIFKVTPAGVYTTVYTFTGFAAAGTVSRLVQASDGNFYGTTIYGGPDAIDDAHPGYGVIFKLTPAGVYSVLHAFTGVDGANSSSPLIQGSDGGLYGCADYGGSGFAGAPHTGSGLVFKVSTSGAYTIVHPFAGLDGERPGGGLLQASDGNFYGATGRGGAYNGGTVFEITPAGTLTTLASRHNIDGDTPLGSLVQRSDGNFYGVTVQGGATGNGTIYQVTPGGVLTVLHSFTDFETSVSGGLALGTDGSLFDLDWPTVFKFGPDSSPPALTSITVTPPFASITATATQKFSAIGYDQFGHPMAVQPAFTWTTSGGGSISSGLFHTGASPGGPYTITASSGAISGTSAATIIAAGTGPTLTTLLDFPGYQNGHNQRVHGGLVLGSDGSFYGVAGPHGFSGAAGMIYRITPAGAMTPLYNFSGDYGTCPYGGLLLANDSEFYGTTGLSGLDVPSAEPIGTVFKITPDGVLTTVSTFPHPEYGSPTGALIQAGNGNFYNAGVDDSGGFLFQMTPSGTISELARYSDIIVQGDQPNGGLVLAPDGNFYGTNANGGASWTYVNPTYLAFGTIFKATPGGVLTNLHSFTGYDGGWPAAGLTLANDGNFYGTTWANGPSSPNFYSGNGTIFRVTPAGNLSTLHEFQATDGSQPTAKLIQAQDGNLYGTSTGANTYATQYGAGNGTLFKISTNGVFTNLYAFSGVDGSDPESSLLQAPDGNFYGATSRGGANDLGTVFRLNTAPRTPSEIDVAPGQAIIRQYTTQQFSAVVFDQFGVSLSPQPAVTWIVSGGGTIDSTGLFTAGSAAGGPFTVTAMSGSVSGTASVTVYVPVLTTITVSPSTASVKIRAHQQFTEVFKDQYGNPMFLPGPGTWSVSGGGTISASGLFTAGEHPGGPFTVTASVGSVTGTATITVTRDQLSTDFNGDGSNDLVLQNASTNQAALWYLQGATVVGGQYLSATPPPGWRVVGAADFNADGMPDLVLQNTTTLQVAIWTMNGATVTGGQYIAGTPPGPIGAVGDFNGDGMPDLAFQRASDNKVVIWTMNGTAFASAQTVGTTPPLGWKLIGSADVNQDGNADLVLQNTTTRRVAFWFLSGTTLIGGNYLSVIPPAGWTPAAFADYNGDGKPDIALQNATTNQIAFWLLDGYTVTNGQYLSMTPSASWRLAKPQ